MAVTATKPTGWRDGPAGALKMVVRDIVFSGSYQDDGSESTLLPSHFGLKVFFILTAQSGASASTALTTANPYAITINSTNTSAEVTFYEDLAVAAAAPIAEKTDNEAFIAGQTLRILAIGY